MEAKKGLHMSWHDVRAIGLMFLMLAAVALAAVFAWQHLAWVSFVLYALLFGWATSQWRQYQRLNDVVRIAEKRLWALEQRAGLGKAWLAELEGARLNQRVMGGALSDHVHWPPADEEYDVDEA